MELKSGISLGLIARPGMRGIHPRGLAHCRRSLASSCLMGLGSPRDSVTLLVLDPSLLEIGWVPCGGGLIGEGGRQGGRSTGDLGVDGPLLADLPALLSLVVF